MTQLVSHLLIATVICSLLLAFPLVLGRLLRPARPSAEKDSIYECGEVSIGTSRIQFDLRIYVVALLFILFEVEVVFFFPWAVVFGSAMQLADSRLSAGSRERISETLLAQPSGSLGATDVISPAAALQLGWLGLADLAIFFGVLLVGFAYLWKRGDLDWVRSAEPPTEVFVGDAPGLAAISFPSQPFPKQLA